MKPVIATMIIMTAILALAVGGFAMMNMGPGDHANCLAAIPGNPACVGGMDPVRFAIMHINALLGISLGIAGSFAAAFFFSFLVPLAWPPAPGAADLPPTISGYLGLFIEGITRSDRARRRWISLLEKRDPSPFCAMNA